MGRNKDDDKTSLASPGRRQAMACMAWAGSGVMWSLVGGVLKGTPLGAPPAAAAEGATLEFVQISDNHFGFNKEANPDVVATARAAIAKVNALPRRPAFVLHTGDVTHLSKPAEFDLAHQVLGEMKAGPIHFTPGEHDILDENPGAQWRQAVAPDWKDGGWYSFDQGGAHFIALVNVMDFAQSGLGKLGEAQLQWLEKDVKALPASTPVVVFAHIPLWSLYPAWGWGTADADQAFATLKRFGSVTVLNGHIHQVVQKVEGNLTFHTAMSTAYPQPQAGTAAGPGPLNVGAERLRSVLGLREVTVKPGPGPLAVVDHSLAET